MTDNEYYILSSPLRFDPGHFHAFNTKTIASGTGAVEILKYNPGITGTTPGTHLLSITAFAFTDLGGAEEDNIKNYRSRWYVTRRITSSTVVQSVDEMVDTDAGNFSVAVNNISSPYDVTLSVGRHASLSRQVTVVVDCYVADQTIATSSIELSNAT